MPTAIVAGVGPGLGSSLARALAHHGYSVALLSRRAESSQAVADEIRSKGGQALILPVDVTQQDAVKEALDQIHREWGAVTALAYNASGYGRGPFLELDPQTIQRGRRELAASLTERPTEQVRLPGAGRPRVEKKTR
jgi:NAD(P)-dependent dehydrogenase (short-subunit alcohol dehydrogenase family)